MMGDWLLEKPSRLEKSEIFFVEKQEMMRHSWKRAFRNCQSDLDYKVLHEERFKRRNTPLKLLDFFLMTLMVVGVVIIAVLLINRIRYTVAVPILAILVFILMWIARYLFYRRMYYYLFLANERINVYSGRWPSIVSLVKNTKGAEIPPEPRAGFDEAAMKSFLAEEIGKMMEEMPKAPTAPPEPETATKTKVKVRVRPAKTEVEAGVKPATVYDEDVLWPELKSKIFREDAAWAGTPETAEDEGAAEPNFNPVFVLDPEPTPQPEEETYEEVFAAVWREIEAEKIALNAAEQKILILEALGL
ncbi:hypothetical protein IKX73_00830 [Candidatus Saccharibacteria bacterium]|nr:hypothetical protein [Candidatus Saccharibacteria bacterium]